MDSFFSLSQWLKKNFFSVLLFESNCIRKHRWKKLSIAKNIVERERKRTKISEITWTPFIWRIDASQPVNHWMCAFGFKPHSAVLLICCYFIAHTKSSLEWVMAENAIQIATDTQDSFNATIVSPSLSLFHSKIHYMLVCWASAFNEIMSTKARSRAHYINLQKEKLEKKERKSKVCRVFKCEKFSLQNEKKKRVKKYDENRKTSPKIKGEIQFNCWFYAHTLIDSNVLRDLKAEFSTTMRTWQAQWLCNRHMEIEY